MEAAADEEAVAAVAAEDAKQKRAAVRPLASFSPFRFPLSFSPLFHSLLFVHSLFFLPYAYKTMQLSFRATSSLLREQRCALSEERTEPTPFSSVSAGSPRGGFFSTFLLLLWFSFVCLFLLVRAAECGVFGGGRCGDSRRSVLVARCAVDRCETGGRLASGAAASQPPADCSAASGRDQRQRAMHGMAWHGTSVPARARWLELSRVTSSSDAKRSDSPPLRLRCCARRADSDSSGGGR